MAANRRIAVLRAREARRPVATPLEWNELERKDMSSQRYTLANLRRRLGQKADPWSAIDRHAANLANARAALVRLGKEHGGRRSTGPET